eukprot:g15628.t1
MDEIVAPEPCIRKIRDILDDIREDLRQPVLLSPSSNTKHKFRTPLMAAAATSQMPIVGAVLAAFGEIFVDEGNEKAMLKARTAEMEKQLEMVDVDGRTLLMLASSGTSPAIFQALSQNLQPAQFREVIKAKDSQGMTILHHAVNGNTDKRARAALGGAPAINGGESLSSVVEGGGAAVQGQAQDSPAAESSRTFSLDERLPVIQSVLEFAKAKLWMPEYRKLLQARDGWHRSIIEHAIMSGRTQIFEAVFDALRKDIHDEKIDRMLDPGVESSHAQTSLRRALDSQEGTQDGIEVQKLVREKAQGLKSDVSKRKDDSTVVSKIQGFIPGNLVVIFQLLLPEFEEDGDGPFYLLMALCAIAPFWSWGSAMSTKRDPDTKNTRARETAAKYILAIPAMFFWGLGTSKIAENTFEWPETASAAALAVASIVIPAIDTYCSGRGLRATLSVITIFLLDLFDSKKKKKARVAERSNQLFGQDDIGSRRYSIGARPHDQDDDRVRVRNPPTPVPVAADTSSMEAGQQRPLTAPGSARQSQGQGPRHSSQRQNAAGGGGTGDDAEHSGSPRWHTSRSWSRPHDSNTIWPGQEDDDVEMKL